MAAGNPVAPRPRPARRPLTRETVIDAALSLIDRKGAEALTMRRLGAELGVEAMSLYNHVRGRPELLLAIGDRMLEPLGELDLGDGWEEACRRFATALREVALARSATFRLVGLEPLDTAHSLRAVERLLGALVGGGFAPVDALAIYRAVVSYARGYALAEATGFTVDAAQPSGRRRLGALSPDDFPILRGHAPELAALDPDAGFERGLEALLHGLADPA